MEDESDWDEDMDNTIKTIKSKNRIPIFEMEMENDELIQTINNLK